MRYHQKLMSKTILLAGLFLITSTAAVACGVPPFANPTLFATSDAEPNKGLKIHAIYTEHPQDPKICIYAATWLEPNQADSIEVYVATYRQHDLEKIADYRSTIADLQLWYAPQIAILPTKFAINPEVMAFGVQVSWQFLAGTFSQNTSQFELLVPAGTSKLRSVLSLPLVESFEYRNCPEVCSEDGKNCISQCEGDNTNSELTFTLGAVQHQHYFDLMVTSTKTSQDVNNTKPPQRQQTEQRYSWENGQYVKN